jgi:gamma-glutamyltranspeptidase/glutathione hydrolase
MVATAFAEPTEAGVEMLQAGGNAIDAAIAAAWALCVCEPSGSGLGGQTVLLVRLWDGRQMVIDGHSHAPAAACAGRISAAEQRRGYRACTIPSTPATLGFAQRQYGRLPLGRVMEPAIRLAEGGYRITELQHRQLRWCREGLLASPAAAGLFLRGGQPLPVGHLFRQGRLAATLRRLGRDGTDDFYRGATARAIVADMEENGGLITVGDLEGLDLPVERRPLTAAYRGCEVASAPPPGGGLQLLLGLKLCERLGLDAFLDNPAAWYEGMANLAYAVFRERERSPMLPGCPPSLYEALLADGCVEELAGRLGGELCAGTVGSPEEGGETTHLCAADGEGNVVSLTQSIQSLFGAKVANSRCGFLYNNYLTTCPRVPNPHQVAGGWVPRSNASPTLLVQGGERPRGRRPRDDERRGARLLVLGAAGSRRITSALLQVIGAMFERLLPLGQALELPRVHATLSGRVWLERPAATEAVRHRLGCRFPKLTIRGPLSFSMGAVQAIEWRRDCGFVGAADPRRDGTAKGIGVLLPINPACGEERRT